MKGPFLQIQHMLLLRKLMKKKAGSEPCYCHSNKDKAKWSVHRQR